MADLPNLLLGSLNPATRKQAELSLTDYSTQPGFLSHLLRLVLEPSQDRAVRLAGSVYLKNIAKLRWEDDVQPIAEQDKAALRNELVPAMIALSNPADKAVRAQVAEAVSLIATLDFPSKWPDLIDQLVASLSESNYSVNIGVLQTAHSIFNQWRSLVRSDDLFSEIILVLNKFITPFLQLFQQTANTLLANSAPSSAELLLLGEAMVLLLDIFYDFNCQDLPPAIEDNNALFFDRDQGYLPRLLNWDSPALKGDPDEPTPSISSRIKTGILESVELFIKMYPEQLQATSAVETFVGAVWNLVGSNKLPNVADDQLVSQSLRFISTAIRTGFYKQLFSSKETISSLVQGVVVPNVAMREHDVEQFEDDPLEFIRLDLALSATGTDLATRRQAAADVLKALVGSGYESEATEIVGSWINSGLSEYEQNKEENWKAKDSAIYLLTAVATRGSTTQHGVTSTNALVDVVQFFSQHIFQDLEGKNGVHSILQVDAIRFLYTFRNQLTKEQLLQVLPYLTQHLSSDNYVCSTYAAITIDRILIIKQHNQLLFGQADIRDTAPQLLDTILNKILSAGTPEKVAENDHFMKCAMRVIVTARQTLTPTFESILTRLVNILGVISKNPSNPRFDQFIFESISGLMRFVVGGTPTTLPAFESSLFGPFTIILQQDIDQYIPYVFQILAQMLNMHKTDIPAQYRSLLPFLLTPAIWQQKGSVPGLVKLLQAYISKDVSSMLANGQIAGVLAVTQQRLIPSRMNDSWGFELIHSVVQNVPPTELRQYFKPILMTLLTRLQTNKTDSFALLFSRFMLFTMAIQVDGLGPDYLIGTLEDIQTGLFTQLLNNFVLPEALRMPDKDRKLAVVGFVRMLTESQYLTQEPAVRSWPSAFTALVKLFSEQQHLEKSKADDVDAAVTDIDFEEQAAGYQAAYSRLAASDGGDIDPVGYVKDPQQFVSQQLSNFVQQHGERARALMNSADAGVVGPFVQALRASGIAI